MSGRYVTHGPPSGLGEFIDSLPATVTKVGCKGKFIYILFDNDYSIWNTLGMAGSWSPIIGKHSRFKLNFKDGSAYFNDIRNFGTIRVTSDVGDLYKKLGSLGPDMLSENVSDTVFMARLRKKNLKTVAEAIMNQSIISGVGNYLKSEALYLAQISPHRNVLDLSDQELSSLNAAIKLTIKSAYKSGGATIHTFLDFDGKEGEYTRRFAVYNQKYDPSGNRVVRETTRDKRTSFWVPEIQK